MDAAKLHSHIDGHLASLVSHNVPAIEQDFVSDLRPFVAGIVETLPAPVETAQNVSLEVGAEKAIVINRIVGADGTVVTMRSEWIDSDGRPRILSGAPIDA